MNKKIMTAKELMNMEINYPDIKVHVYMEYEQSYGTIGTYSTVLTDDCKTVEECVKKTIDKKRFFFNINDLTKIKIGLNIYETIYDYTLDLNSFKKDYAKFEEFLKNYPKN